MKASLILALVTLCTRLAPGDTTRTEAASKANTTHAEAAALCPDDLHLPTGNDVKELLGDCVATSYGWQCTPCAVRGCEERYGGDDVLTHGHVWTSSACMLPGRELGFYFADLYLGQIVCSSPREPEALPLCVR